MTKWRFIPVISLVVISGLSACRTSSKNQASGVLDSLAANPNVVRQSLGLAAFDATTGRSQIFQFSVPNDALSFTIYIREPNTKDFYLITDVSGPNGKIVESESGQISDLTRSGRFGMAELNSLNRSLTFDAGFSSLLVPNNPSVALAGGKWEFTVIGIEQMSNGSRPSSASPMVEVLIKRGSINADRGVLTVGLFFTGSHGITKANYQNDPDFVEILQELKSVYGNAGIDIQVVSTTDLPSGFQSVAYGSPRFQDIFKATQGDAAVNLIFVDDLQLNTEAAGFAGGLPGYPFVSGQAYAGVLVSTKPVNSATTRRWRTGLVLAHELGHYLGLPHTFEGLFPREDGDIDQLSDTPQDFSRNVMDTAFSPFSTDSTGLTPQQRQLLLRSPAVKIQ